ncbi:hypothetical protein JCM33374_g2382 [Metschnikowia sp. JCM 33374]|nr:hypothetical protein JCM33374_g2382 [Metschnikowia sp. JCM 33374]
MNRKKKSTEILAQLGDPLPLPYKANTTQIKNESAFEDFSGLPPSNAYEPIRKRRVFERRDFSGAGLGPKPTNPSRSERFERSDRHEEHVPLPIWRRDRGAGTEQRSQSNPGNSGTQNNSGFSAAMQFSDSEGEETHDGAENILDQLQHHLDTLKTLYDNKDAIELDQSKFEKILAMLEQMIEQKQQESIVHELERIQNQVRVSSQNRVGQNRVSSQNSVRHNRALSHTSQNLDPGRTVDQNIASNIPPPVAVHTDKQGKWRAWLLLVGVCFLLLASFIAGQFSYEYCYYFC